MKFSQGFDASANLILYLYIYVDLIVTNNEKENFN